MAGVLFVEIKGITADSEDAGHEGYFDATSISFGGQSPTNASTGLPTGRVMWSPFSFTVAHDGNLAMVYKYMRENAHVSVKIIWRTQVKKEKIDAIDMKLEDARITSVSTQVQEEAGVVSSQTTIQMAYGKAELTANGEKNKNVMDSWQTRAHE
jgi:type VI secretion system Hcp family effector